MRNVLARSSSVAAMIILGGSAIGHFLPQGARPIDGELGIDSEGKVKGILRANSESSTGIRVSIAIAIGNYATEAEEDAAIAQGTNGSRGFKVISLPDSQSTIDLSAPWLAGTSLPQCERATLIVRSLDLRTNGISIARNRMQQGMMTVLQAKVRPPEPLGNKNQTPQPTFATEQPTFILKSRSLPIDGLVGMDAGGRLTGYVAPGRDHDNLEIAFAPGRYLTLDDGLRMVANGNTPGVIAFKPFNETTYLNGLTPKGSNAGAVIQQMGGLVIVRESEENGNVARYSYLEVAAGAPSKWIPTRNPRELPINSKSTGASLVDILSRSLPIDGALDLDPASGTLTGKMTIKSPDGPESFATIEVASVGLEMGNGDESSEKLLKRLESIQTDPTKRFTSISFGTSYKLVHRKAGPGELQFAKGAKVALLFKVNGRYGLEYFVSIINRSGKPPRGEKS